MAAGVAQIPWYATLFRGDQFEAAVREIAPIAMRYGATDYIVYRNRDDMYKFMQASTFEEKSLVSIARGEVDLGGESVDEQTKQGFEALTAWMATALADDVKEVRLSHRLVDSPAVLVGEPGDLTPTLEKMYRAMGQPLPKVKRTLELNPKHALVTGLKTAHEAHPDDPDLADTARLLYGMALLAEGGELAEPAKFVSILSKQLESMLS